jgi:hypothetical protein
MSTHESFIYNLTKIDIMLENDKNKNIPKNKKLFLRIIVHPIELFSKPSINFLNILNAKIEQSLLKKATNNYWDLNR